MTQFQPGAVVYTQGSGSSSLSGLFPVIQTRAPAIYDINYQVGQTWVDTVTNQSYILTSLVTVSGVTTPTWTLSAQGSAELATLTGNTGGAISPVAGNINILGGQGVTVAGAGNTLTVSVFGAAEGSVTTVGATTATVLTIPLASVPSVYSLDGFVVGLDSATPAGCAYALTGGVRTTGSAGVVISTPMVDNFEETALSTASVDLSISGNSLLVTVTGVAGHTIAWEARLQFLNSQG